VQLSASGGATLNLASLSLGTHSISASYGGDANDSPSTSAVLTITVSNPEYAMVVNAASVNLAPGQPSSLTVTLIPKNGFNQPIELSCSGLPQGTTCSFNPATVTPNGAPVMSTVTMMVPAQMALAPRQAPRSGLGGVLAFGMPWGFISLLGLAKTRKRSQIAQWWIRLMVAAAFIAGSLWVSGCGYSANGRSFTVTLTASASHAQTHTSQVTVLVQQ
jgi:Bacterial Ig-like domain (group 3)